MVGAIYRTHLMGSKQPSPPDPEVGVSLCPHGKRFPNLYKIFESWP